MLQNPAFDQGLAEWEGSGAIERSLGYPRPACVALAGGASVSQQVGVSAEALYTLHYFYRLESGAQLVAGYGDATQTHTSAPTDAWREGVLYFAPDVSAQESVTFAAAGGTVYVDAVTLMGGGLPTTRRDLATRIAARLAELATDAGLSSAASGDSPEGDYSAAIDEALRALAATNRWGDPDVTCLAARNVNDVLEAAHGAMLQRLRAKYALQTDVTLGPRSESRSQIAGSIDAMLSGSGGDRRIKSAPLRHQDWRR